MKLQQPERKFMKTLFAAALTIFCFAPPAFAMHAYYSMECRSGAYQFRYKGNYPVGGDYGLALKTARLDQDGQELLVLPNDPDTYGQDELGQAQALFTNVSSRTIGRAHESNDGCFDHSEWRSRGTVRWTHVSEQARQQLGLQENQLVTFTCNETSDIPHPTHCN
jgi:hypothetical protein